LQVQIERGSLTARETVDSGDNYYWFYIEIVLNFLGIFDDDYIIMLSMDDSLERSVIEYTGMAGAALSREFIADECDPTEMSNMFG
jgi:hypothetical protein